MMFSEELLELIVVVEEWVQMKQRMELTEVVVVDAESQVS